MNIIEKEIERREALIEDKSAKEDEILELEERLEELRAEVQSIDVDTLEQEIEELRCYLPVEEVPVDTVPPPIIPV